MGHRCLKKGQKSNCCEVDRSDIGGHDGGPVLDGLGIPELFVELRCIRRFGYAFRP